METLVSSLFISSVEAFYVTLQTNAENVLIYKSSDNTKDLKALSLSCSCNGNNESKSQQRRTKTFNIISFLVC